MLLQVEVFINGIPSKCSGDCGFGWSEEKTPVVTGISPSQGLPSKIQVHSVSGISPTQNKCLMLVRDQFRSVFLSVIDYLWLFQDQTDWGLF